TIRISLDGHSRQGRRDNRSKDFVTRRLVENRVVAVCAHSPCVGSLVIVKDRLVVLRKGQGKDRLPIRQNNKGYFFASEAFFNDNPIAGVPQRSLAHELCEGTLRLCTGLGHHDTLAGCESVGFDRYREGKRVQCLDGLVIARGDGKPGGW